MSAKSKSSKEENKLNKKRQQLFLYSAKMTYMHTSIRKKKSKRGNRLDTIPHSTYSTTSFVLKKRQTLNWLNKSFLPMIFVFFTAKYKEDCRFFSTVIAMMACMAQSQADVYRSVKRNPKNVCFKNRDLKKGVRLDNILHTTYYTTLFVRNKRLNIF